MRLIKGGHAWPARSVRIASVAVLATCMSLTLAGMVAYGEMQTNTRDADVLAGTWGVEASADTWDADEGLIRSSFVVPEGDTELAAAIAVEVVVLADPVIDYEIILPAPEWGDKGVHVLSDRPVLIEKGNRRSAPDRWEIRLMPMETGEHEITGPVVAYSQGNASDSTAARTYSTLQLPSHTLKVVNPLDRASDSELGPMKEPLAAKPDYRRPLIILLAAAAIVSILTVILWYLRRRSGGFDHDQAPPRRPAHEVAYERLQIIQQSRLIEQGLHREFHFAISECLREYLENRFGVPALEMTTEEFLEYSRTRLDLPEICTSGAADLMRLNDLVKFAKRQSITDEMRHVFDSVRSLIDETKEPIGEVKEPIYEAREPSDEAEGEVKRP